MNPPDTGKIPLIKPFLPITVHAKVSEVLSSGQLTEGKVTKEFESAFCNYTGVRHSLAVCNCTVGLEIALRAVGVGSGDEVIVPDYTYPATASVVAIVGAKIVLVDVKPKSMLIDYDAIETAITKKTKAIIPVSAFGNPLDYERLNEIKRKHSLLIIEDAACSIGASCDGKMVGNMADISVFSLHPRKFITTGEGGIITTNNSEWAEWMDSYKHFGMRTVGADREKICFERIGTNYKLSNILSAVGLVQMQEVEKLLARRRELASIYLKKLSNVSGLEFPSVKKGSNHSYQTFCVFVRNRDLIMKSMREQGIEVQIGTYSLHRHPAFSESDQCLWSGAFSGSDYACDHSLALPLFHEMTDVQQERVVCSLLSEISGHR